MNLNTRGYIKAHEFFYLSPGAGLTKKKTEAFIYTFKQFQEMITNGREIFVPLLEKKITSKWWL